MLQVISAWALKRARNLGKTDCARCTITSPLARKDVGAAADRGAQRQPAHPNPSTAPSPEPPRCFGELVLYRGVGRPPGSSPRGTGRTRQATGLSKRSGLEPVTAGALTFSFQTAACCSRSRPRGDGSPGSWGWHAAGCPCSAARLPAGAQAGQDPS